MLSTNRPLEIAAFLDQYGWGEAEQQAFDGDFSPRRYARLTRDDGGTAILMDADADQKTAQFVTLSSVLQHMGIKSPEVYAAAPSQGLVLMQDFGTRNVGALLDQGADAKTYLCRSAEVLATLHGKFARTDSLGLDLPLYTTDLFTSQAELFLDEYIPFAKQREASDEERRDFRSVWRTVLRTVETLPKTLLLRDFMPDNLMDLPSGEIGVLDFQDAGVGPVAYDLASLCEEVRRDGAFDHMPAVIAQYREKTQNSLSQNDLVRACTVLSAQRHARVFGLLVRLALKSGKRDKLAFIPRLTNHMQRILKEPCLLPVRDWMEHTNVL